MYMGNKTQRKVVFSTINIFAVYYDPQSAGINVQSSQSESTPRRLTLLFRLAQSGAQLSFVVSEIFC